MIFSSENGARLALALALVGCGGTVDVSATAPPPVVDAAPPPVVDAAPPPVVDAAPPPVVDAAPPPVVDAAPPNCRPTTLLPCYDGGSSPVFCLEAPDACAPYAGVTGLDDGSTLQAYCCQ